MSDETIPVGLSSASVYPQNTEAAFRYAAELGYDGVELMVWAEPASQSVVAVRRYIRDYGVPVLAVHAPCLLISQRVWGRDPAEKLHRSVDVAAQLGAETVVVHPPFRWQRRYAARFSDIVAELEEDNSVLVAVENMFPMRTAGWFGGAGEQSGPGAGRRGLQVTAFAPSHDPTTTGYAHYALDFSHTATAGMDALALADRMGSGLVHLHLADGTGQSRDEHLLPGTGTQHCALVCAHVVAHGFAGQAVVEINTQQVRGLGERREMLRRGLVFARRACRRRPGLGPND